ncbi:DNA-binding transcriptional regulator, LysR family [Polaromonas sp. OV174]|uniref:LysR substrate-binding domain-containing protein n=1 Tax=Polaromonas sp. OV174 TaxID=1855300 RepID=UPI0008F429CC|nr:LysR substrate-binding domain-containing protein [Polaromonas sp. OV174]SFC05577.1 DNA-binding transcriptional regulator, LysR family [Polaromonas sp. OV174]
MEHSKLSLARRLKLQQLAIFEQVVNTGSILAASRELHMTQPAVSKSIHELEGHFDQALFTRSKRGVRLTEFGELLQRHARSLLAELRFLADNANAWNTGVSGQVVVGTLISASASLLPKAVVRLRETAPNVVVTVRVGSNDVLFPELVRGEVDVVVGLLPGESPNRALTHVPLYDETLCAVVARHHPLALDTSIDVQQLQDMVWIIPTPESAAMRSAQLFFAAAHMVVPKRIVESVSILTNLGLLLESSTIALMPYAVAEQFVRSGLLSILPLGVASPFGKVGYSLFADRPPTAATQRLLAALQEVGAAVGSAAS